MSRPGSLSSSRGRRWRRPSCGAWKVAYADFVTAMMAFFLLMWLLNATTEDQRKGLADYFDPSIPVSRISGAAMVRSTASRFFPKVRCCSDAPEDALERFDPAAFGAELADEQAF
ncbi:MAG: flagellar motor protein MotB [Parvularculaceae bacterium]